MFKQLLLIMVLCFYMPMTYSFRFALHNQGQPTAQLSSAINVNQVTQDTENLLNALGPNVQRQTEILNQFLTSLPEQPTLQTIEPHLHWAQGILATDNQIRSAQALGGLLVVARQLNEIVVPTAEQSSSYSETNQAKTSETLPETGVTSEGNVGSLPTKGWWSWLGLGKITTQIKRILIWSAFLR